MCNDCSEMCSDLFLLKKHRLIQTGEKPFKCEVCGHKFKPLDSMKEQRQIHASEKPHSCEDCGKKLRELDTRVELTSNEIDSRKLLLILLAIT